MLDILNNLISNIEEYDKALKYYQSMRANELDPKKKNVLTPEQKTARDAYNKAAVRIKACIGRIALAIYLAATDEHLEAWLDRKNPLFTVKYFSFTTEKQQALINSSLKEESPFIYSSIKVFLTTCGHCIKGFKEIKENLLKNMYEQNQKLASINGILGDNPEKYLEKIVTELNQILAKTQRQFRLAVEQEQPSCSVAGSSQPPGLSLLANVASAAATKAPASSASFFATGGAAAASSPSSAGALASSPSSAGASASSPSSAGASASSPSSVGASASSPSSAGESPISLFAKPKTQTASHQPPPPPAYADKQAKPVERTRTYRTASRKHPKNRAQLPNPEKRRRLNSR